MVDDAEWHGVLPVLARWLAAGRASFVPRDIAAEVRHRAHAETMHGLALAAELVALVHQLEFAGIPVITLKGPALAVRAYDDVAMRPPGELDLLVHAANASHALVVLEIAGYTRTDGASQGKERNVTLRELEHHAALTNAVGTRVQLHWGIVERQLGLHVVESFWWADARRVPIAGAEVSALGTEALLVYLAVHGAKHEWRYLRWIGDIAAVARLSPVNWARVRSISAQLGALRMTRLALALAADVLGAQLPQAARVFAHEDATVAPLVAVVREQLVSGEPVPVDVGIHYQLALRDRMRDQAAYAVRFAITPAENDGADQVAALPAAWRSLYFLLRPVRAARRWSQQALGRPS